MKQTSNLPRNEIGQAANLVIYDLNVADSGKYHCQVSNPGSDQPKVSKFATIEIKPSAETKGDWPPQEVVGDYKVRKNTFLYSEAFVICHV